MYSKKCMYTHKYTYTRSSGPYQMLQFYSLLNGIDIFLKNACVNILFWFIWKPNANNRFQFLLL